MIAAPFFNQHRLRKFALVPLMSLILMGCASDTSSTSSVVSQTPSETIGVIGAMESEITTIRNSMENAKTTTIAGMQFVEGTISGKDVVVVQCGMGKVNAGICAQTLINDFHASCVINTGVAGSLTSDLGINDFVVSVDAVQHDYDVSPIGFKKAEIPYTGMVSFPADERLRAKAIEAVKKAAPSSKALEGRVCSGDQFISTKEQKDRITSEFGGLCAEMEGGAIAQVCYLNDTPYVIIRTISDDSNSVSFDEFQAEAADKCAKTVLTMVAEL